MTINWEKFSLTYNHPNMQRWLIIQSNLGLTNNTLEAYARALEDYLKFSIRHSIAEINSASREQIALYVNDLINRTVKCGLSIKPVREKGLANSTIQQRLTAIRLYYDYLMEEGYIESNPVGRGRYTQGKSFGGMRERGLIPRFRKLPWIPTDEVWKEILEIAKMEPLRNKLMLAFAYDAGLRREELCLLKINDIDPSRRLIHIRAENTKNRQERILPYSVASSELYVSYLQHRKSLSNKRDHLFLSESRRNKTQPISLWTWTKVIESIARRANIPQFTTHTLRHLCLTDLARAGWDIHEIATFAGHRSTVTTLQYIHLSGRDLAIKYEQTMKTIHASRHINDERGA